MMSSPSEWQLQRNPSHAELLRELTNSDAIDWGSPLPDEMEAEWRTWKESLQDLIEFKIPRAYTPTTLTTAQMKELHIFSDVSVKASCSLPQGDLQWWRVSLRIRLGKGKTSAPSWPYYPKVGAVCGCIEIAELVESELDINTDKMQFYTDSKIVLGYMFWVQPIRKFTKPEQWHYVCTTQNPADHATRFVPAAKLASTTWLTGPSFLSLPEGVPTAEEESYELIDPESDTEVRSHVCRCNRAQSIIMYTS